KISENALKRRFNVAIEFIEVGKPPGAWIPSTMLSRGRSIDPVIEPIMLSYLELCVELKKAHTAKEGLYQYRIMCQSVSVDVNVNISVMGLNVIKDNAKIVCFILVSFLRKRQQKIESRRRRLRPTESISIVEVDDLDNLSMADMTLLNVVTQERSGRTALIPWVKFLWESYTQCLDLLRNNPRLENLYHDIAQMEALRTSGKHFDDIINRQGSQMNSIDFSSPETQQLNMETRFLELWQDAYKAIEDIHLLMNQSKKSQTRMMAYYYQKLSLVFWKAGNLLFHAATLMKYYLLCKDMKKNVSADELQKNASQVVLATMAIPFPVLHPEFERFVETDKECLKSLKKLATLLFLPQPPTRASIIRDISRHGILTNAIQPLQDLYEVLENQFNPLSLCADVEGNPVYQTIDYDDHLMNMTVFSNQIQLEQILVDAVRYTDMQITVDHRSNCIKFGASLAEASREDLPEGPHLQIMPSETIRLQLVNIMDCLQDTVEMISPVQVSNLGSIKTTEAQYHRSLMARHKIIAERREELERSAVDKEYEEKHRAEQMIKQQMMMEAKRLETEREEREKKKVKSEKLELQKRLVEERFKLIGQTPIGLKIIEKFQADESSNMDLETVLQRQQEELQKEAKEHLVRMKSQEKRLDHIERAKRIEEVSVIEQYMDKKKDEEKVEWEAHDAQRIAHLIEERKIAVANRDRMKRMRDDKNKFLKNLLDARRDLFMEKLNEFEKSFRTEKSRRMAERKDQRKQERRRKYDEEKAAAERSRLDAIRKANEEDERVERVRIEKELEERNRVTLEKQLAKQREIEEREERDRQERLTKAASAAVPGATPPAAEIWRAKSATGEKGTPSAPPSARAAADPSPAGSGNVWVPKAIREKKAAAMTGDLPSQENVPPPSWTSDDREERPFERKIERGPDGDRDGERKRMDRGGDRDWGGGYRGDKDRGFDRPRGDRGFDKETVEIVDWMRPESRGDRGFDREWRSWIRGDRGGDRDRGDRPETSSRNGKGKTILTLALQMMDHGEGEVVSNHPEGRWRGDIRGGRDGRDRDGPHLSPGRWRWRT
ncbi:Eukaryotic translation initiation factor 3 subunit A, partial [Orchesella cincta]